jgi:hypothetical protein
MNSLFAASSAAEFSPGHLPVISLCRESLRFRALLSVFQRLAQLGVFG